MKESIDFVRSNCRLHILFGLATNCLPLSMTITTLELQVMAAVLAATKLDQTDKHSPAQHRQVIAAIAAGDPRAARDALDEHLSGADVLLREMEGPRPR